MNTSLQAASASIELAHPGVLPGGVALFTQRDGSEALVALIETRDPLPPRALAEEISSAVRWALRSRHALTCEEVVVGGSGVVPITPEGDIDVEACRRAFTSGALAERSHSVPASDGDTRAIDPRTSGVSASFLRMIKTVARFLTAPQKSEGEKRPLGVAARGWLEVLSVPNLPAHAFFEPGRRLPVLLRHDNRTTQDDAAPDARVAALRLLDPRRPLQLDRGLLDLVLLTGRCFFHRTAEDFLRFSIASPGDRDAIFRREPRRREAFWESVRTGDSYTQFHYHSQTASRFLAADGTAWFARYRLRAPEQPDTGHVDSEGALFPAETLVRHPGDTRSPSYLREEWRDRVLAGVAYTLEVQLMEASQDPDGTDRQLDCTAPWSEEEAPWRAIASLHFNEVVPASDVADLEFNPGNAPSDLGVTYAAHERLSASIDHVRTIVYEVAARARRGRPLSLPIQALIESDGAGGTARPATLDAGARPPSLQAEAEKPHTTERKPKQTIAIVGAGASGLTLAHELEKRGHQVTVFEREAVVGGMCRTEHFGGVTYDLGAHMIYPEVYPAIVELARGRGTALVPDFPACTIRLDGGGIIPDIESPAREAARQRVAQLLATSGILGPGLETADRALALPIRDWIAREGVQAVWDELGTHFVAAGYGYLEEEVPATYLLKFLVHTRKGDSARYRLQGGFQSLWQSLAAELKDVRTNCEVQGAERDAEGVRLHVRKADRVGSLRFDELVIAHSPRTLSTWLDVSDEERELFARVRELSYVSAVVTARWLPPELRGKWCFIPENTARADRAGHVLAILQIDPEHPVVGLIAYAPPPGSDLETLITEDFARLGAAVSEVHWLHQWSYFPHFSAEDLRADIIRRFERLQGQRHTWHASTLLSFELTECAAGYSRALAERIHRGLGDAPARSPAAQAFESFRTLVESEKERVVRYLQQVVADELQSDSLPDPGEPLALLGIDSLRAASIQYRVVSDSGFKYFADLIAEAPDLRTLGAWLVAAIASPPHDSGESPDHAPPTGDEDAETQGLLELLNQ